MMMASNAVGHSEIMRPLAHAFSRKAVPDRTERSSKGLLRLWVALCRWEHNRSSTAKTPRLWERCGSSGKGGEDSARTSNGCRSSAAPVESTLVKAGPASMLDGWSLLTNGIL
jgi:hypothetical protein